LKKNFELIEKKPQRKGDRGDKKDLKTDFAIHIAIQKSEFLQSLHPEFESDTVGA
jgi:hypothetical protein